MLRLDRLAPVLAVVSLALAAPVAGAQEAKDTKADAKKVDDKKAEESSSKSDAAKDDEPAPSKDEPAKDEPKGEPEPAEAPPPAPPPGDGLPRARWHPKHAIELEVHGSIAAFDEYFVGLGGGLRVSVPVFEHAPIRSIDDTIAVGVGLDVIRYAGYRPNDPREPTIGVVAYHVPLYFQWNVWLGSRASLFVEPTLLWRFAQYTDNCGTLPCAPTSRFMPTGSLGMRFRVTDHVAATLRAGWPVASLGVSWL